MSADNFVQVRRLKDGWYWNSFSMSGDHARLLKDSEFTNGPFATPAEAEADAWEACQIIEYGVQVEPGHDWISTSVKLPTLKDEWSESCTWLVSDLVLILTKYKGVIVGHYCQSKDDPEDVLWDNCHHKMDEGVEWWHPIPSLPS